MHELQVKLNTRPNYYLYGIGVCACMRVCACVCVCVRLCACVHVCAFVACVCVMVLLDSDIVLYYMKFLLI